MRQEICLRKCFKRFADNFALVTGFVDQFAHFIYSYRKVILTGRRRGIGSLRKKAASKLSLAGAAFGRTRPHLCRFFCGVSMPRLLRSSVVKKLFSSGYPVCFYPAQCRPKLYIKHAVCFTLCR